MIGYNLFIIIIFLITTAFFVAAEFAFVKVRPSRINQLVLEGNKKAVNVQKIITNLDGYLSASQLGITITSLGIGWLGEPTVEKILDPVIAYFDFTPQLTTTLSLLLSFMLVTFFQVVLGELSPKSFAIQKAEAISLWLSSPMILFYRIMYPFIWILNISSVGITRLFGLKPVNAHDDAHTEEELRIILSESYESGEINQSEYKYVSRIFEFDELKAREIMVPRTDMICLYSNKSLEENLTIIKEEQYTRYPVAVENKDNIIGIINTKRLFFQYLNDPSVELTKVMRPVLSVSENMPIKSLLKELQKKQVHIAILLDEYGGTAGMVTIEDILEEIVGEIRDEFDADENMEIEEIEKHRIVVDGKTSINDVMELLDSEMEPEDFDTIGGWLHAKNPTLKEGEEWNYLNFTFKVCKKEKHRYRKIEIFSDKTIS